jgi:glutamate formiminotransferase / 5-formyltetrahydrofolate cyclo-ligase
VNRSGSLGRGPVEAATPIPSWAVLECVVNISEGRHRDVVDALAAACRPVLLDVHTDVDHHRSVLTLAGPPGVVAEAALALVRAAVERINMSDHAGVHPRLGAADVVPFVPLDVGPSAGATDEATVRTRRLQMAGEVARAWGQRAAEELGVPVFLYGSADPQGRSLPDVRREAFRGRQPDFGPGDPHPTAGAMAVGARAVLVALNCDLAPGDGGSLEADLAVARSVAGVVRERDGGLPGVRALGFALASKGRAQVSMNLVDLTATGVETACEAVRREAERHGRSVTAVELVGLLPAAELERCSREFLDWSGLSPDRTIEARLRPRR